MEVPFSQSVASLRLTWLSARRATTPKRYRHICTPSPPEQATYGHQSTANSNKRKCQLQPCFRGDGAAPSRLQCSTGGCPWRSNRSSGAPKKFPLKLRPFRISLLSEFIQMPWEVSVSSIGSAVVTIQASTFFIGSQKGKNVLPDYFRSSSVIGCLYSAHASFPPAAIGPDVVLEGRAL